MPIQSSFWLRLLPQILRQKFEHRPNLQKALNNIGWLFADKIVRMGIGLFVGIWMARYLGPEQFGLMSYAAAIVAMFGAIGEMGLNSIVVRDLVTTPEKASDIMGSAFVLQLIGGFLALMFATITIYIIRPEDVLAKAMVIILGCSMLFKATDTVRYWFESIVKSKYVVWLENGSFLIFAAVKIALILNKATLIAFVWVTLIEGGFLAIGLLIVYHLRGGRLAIWQAKLDRAKLLLKESWPLIFSGLAVMIYMRIDQIMLGEMLGDQSVGVYSAAVRISEVWYFIPISIVSSFFPSIIEAKKRSENLYLEHLQKLYRLLTILSIVMAIGFTFFSEWLVILLFGANYEAAASSLAIMGWAGIFVSLGVSSSRWYLMEGMTHLLFFRTFYGAVINIGLNFILIPTYGVNGAAIATVISYSFAALWFDFFTQKTRPIFYLKIKCFSFKGHYANY